MYLNVKNNKRNILSTYLVDNIMIMPEVYLMPNVFLGPNRRFLEFFLFTIMNDHEIEQIYLCSMNITIGMIFREQFCVNAPYMHY